MLRIIQPNTWYADHHGEPCKILRATSSTVHYLRHGRTCIASMQRFNADFEPLSKLEAKQIAHEVETADHIALLRRMKDDRNAKASTERKLACPTP